MIGVRFPALQHKLHHLQLLNACSLALRGLHVSGQKPTGWIGQEFVFEGCYKMLKPLYMLWQVEAGGLDVQHILSSYMLSAGLPAGAGERM